MSKSQSPEKISSQIDSKEMREIRKKIKKAEWELRNDVILDGLQKFDKFDSKQQKQFLRTACKQLPGISWEAVKNNPLAEIKSLVEKKMEKGIKKIELSGKNISKVSNDRNNTKGIDIQELPSSIASITEAKTQEIINVLNEFSPEEQQKLTVLDHKVNRSETFETSIRTLDQVKDFLKGWLDDYKGTDNPKAFIDHIIVPTLKLVAMKSDEIKNDSTVQNYVNQIKKIAMEYMD